MRKQKKEEIAKTIEQQENLSQEEKLLNEAFVLTFNCKSGEKVLDYLVGKTLHLINGPEFNPNALAHYEGQRFIVAEIKRRILLGEQRK